MKAVLGELTEAPRNQPLGSGAGGGEGQLGLRVRTLTPDDVQLGLSRNTAGLLVESVDPIGPAAEGGVRSGDVIVKANRQAVRSIEDLRSAMQKSGTQPVLLLINRGGRTKLVAVKPVG